MRVENCKFSMTDKVKGYIYGIIAAASYGTNPIFAKPLYDDGMNPDSVLMFRYLLAIPMMMILIISKRQSFTIPRGSIGLLGVLGILMALSSLTLFASYLYMPVGIASTMLFVYPIMVALIMSLIFHEKLTSRTMLCLVLALAGISLLYKGEDGATLSLWGTVLVMLSSLSYAIYMVMINRTSARTLNSMKVTLYVLISGVFLFFFRLFFFSELTLPEHLWSWLNVLGVAFFPTAVSFYCIAKSIQYVGSTNTAILGALEPVTAVFLGMIILGEMVTVRESIGMIMILGAVTILVYKKK